MKASTDTAVWVRNFFPAENSSVRLVCLPHAGGSASFYLPLSKLLSPNIEVAAIQYPGRQDRRHEPCILDIPTLAKSIYNSLRGLPEKPTMLFGHSMGATVAYELANLFQETTPAVHLFVSGRRAPSVSSYDRRHLLDDSSFLAELTKLGGTDPRVFQDKELLDLALPALRADYRAIETYQWSGGNPLDCPITALAGTLDRGASLWEVAEWARHSTGEFSLSHLNGGHFFLVQHLQFIAKLITDASSRNL